MARDINPSGEPGPDDDEAGKGVTAPNDQPQANESDDGTGAGPEQESKEELGDVAGIQEELEAAANEGDPVSEGSSEGGPDALPENGSEASTPPPEEATKIDFLPAPAPPPPAFASDVPPAGSLDIGGGGEAPAPTEEEMGEVQGDLEGFGDQLNQFNEAGGAEGNGPPDVPGETSNDSTGPLGQFADATVHYATTANEFLTEHSRMLNDLQRRLELERL